MSETAKASHELKAPKGRPGPYVNGATGAPGAPGAPGGQGARGTISDSGAPDFGAELQVFLAALLERQCRLVGAVAGVIYLAEAAPRPASFGATFVLAPGEPGRGGAALPAAARVALDDSVLSQLARFGAEASAGPRGRTRAEVLNVRGQDERGIYQPDPTHRVLAAPLVAADQVHGATVVVVPLVPRQDVEESLERLVLASLAYEAFLWRNHCLSEAHTKTRLRETLELLDAAQQTEDAPTMGEIFCHELQRRFGCTRVSIGLIRRDRLRVVAVSGADDVDAHAAVVESLEAVMEECAEQDVEIVYPPIAADEPDPALRRVTRAHEQHSTRHGPVAMLSLPLRVSGDLVGVVTLEREPRDPFPAGAVPLLRLVAEYIGPALWTRRMADRGVLAVMRDRLGEIAVLAVGPRYTGLKAVLVLLLAAFLAIALIPIPGRVSADFETRAEVSRTVPPPFEGFLDKVQVKPGDTVKAGDVMATMDLRETLLELEKARNTVQKLRTQQDDARARGQQGDAAIAAAAIAESQFEIKFLEDRVRRGAITAPITGTVSRGDIEPLAGAKVEPSQPLFEVIDADRLVLVLQVREQDIGDVEEGQEGRMALASLPDRRHPIRVVRIRPMAETVSKGNVYLVEAELLEPVDSVKAGMTGTARLENGRTTILWELVRPMADAIRMRLWW